MIEYRAAIADDRTERGAARVKFVEDQQKIFEVDRPVGVGRGVREHGQTGASVGEGHRHGTTLGPGARRRDDDPRDLWKVPRHHRPEPCPSPAPGLPPIGNH